MDAVLPVEPFLEYLFVLVDVVQDIIRVLLLAGCKHDYLVEFGQLFKTIDNIRPDSNMNLRVLVIEVESLLESFRYLTLEFCGDECLVHVEDQEFGCCLLAQVQRLQEHVFLVVFIVFELFKCVTILE